MTTLAELSIGTVARVAAIAGGDDTVMRMMEMGLVPGVDVRMVRAAPLGDPLEFEVRGYRLSIRKAEAARIDVEVVV